MSEGKRDRGCVGGWLSCFYVWGKNIALQNDL